MNRRLIPATVLSAALPALLASCEPLPDVAELTRSGRLSSSVAIASLGNLPRLSAPDAVFFPNGATGVDLVVASVGVPEEVVPLSAEAPAHLTVIIENAGAEALDPALLPRNDDGVPVISFRLARRWLNGAEVPAGFARWDIPVREALGPDEMVLTRIPLAGDGRWLPTGVETAVWDIQVEVDPMNRVPEWDESNNRSDFVHFTVVPAAAAPPEAMASAN